MTVSVRSKPCELGWPNEISSYDTGTGLYDYSCSVTERQQDLGNEIYFVEETSLFNPKTYMSIENDKFSVYVTHTSYDKLVYAMFEETDVLAQSMEALMSMGFEVKMPDPRGIDGAGFRSYHDKLPAGAKRRWNRLWQAQKRETEKEYETA